MQPRSLDLNQFVENHLKSSTNLINEHVKVEFMSEENLGNVYADPANLDQILTSLFLNANTAMADGGELLVLTRNVKTDTLMSHAVPNSEGDRYVMLSITETGNGLDKSIDGIVKQLTGKVRCKAGEGTTYRIYFPSFDERG